jgi:hypothetical protein
VVAVSEDEVASVLRDQRKKVSPSARVSSQACLTRRIACSTRAVGTDGPFSARAPPSVPSPPKYIW